MTGGIGAGNLSSSISSIAVAATGCGLSTVVIVVDCFFEVVGFGRASFLKNFVKTKVFLRPVLGVVVEFDKELVELSFCIGPYFP